MVDPFVANLANVAVLSAIYYIWRVYGLWRCKRSQTLRQRVTYMLWVAAQRAH